jgi:hypothetical protein
MAKSTSNFCRTGRIRAYNQYIRQGQGRSCYNCHPVRERRLGARTWRNIGRTLAAYVANILSTRSERVPPLAMTWQATESGVNAKSHLRDK